MYRNGTLELKPRIKKPERKCTIEYCNRKHHAKGYCVFDYRRYKYNIPFDRPVGIKGENNPRWNGGVSIYPKQKLMIKNRLIKIEQTKGKCERCPKKGKKVHHIDFSKTNHNLENLLWLCNKCHGQLHQGRKKTTSIWIRKYGMTIAELCKKLRCSYFILKSWDKQGWINSFLGKESIAV